MIPTINARTPPRPNIIPIEFVIPVATFVVPFTTELEVCDIIAPDIMNRIILKPTQTKPATNSSAIFNTLYPDYIFNLKIVWSRDLLHLKKGSIF